MSETPDIGSLLDGNDDEPPVGTVVEDEDGTQWQRTSDSDGIPWRSISGGAHDDGTPLWSAWADVPGWGTVRVVSVPEPGATS